MFGGLVGKAAATGMAWGAARKTGGMMLGAFGGKRKKGKRRSKKRRGWF